MKEMKFVLSKQPSNRLLLFSDAPIRGRKLLSSSLKSFVAASRIHCSSQAKKAENKTKANRIQKTGNTSEPGFKSANRHQYCISEEMTNKPPTRTRTPLRRNPTVVRSPWRATSTAMMRPLKAGTRNATSVVRRSRVVATSYEVMFMTALSKIPRKTGSL